MSVVLGFQRGLSISGGEFAKTQTAGMEPKCPLVAKSAQINLNLSGQGNFGVGITNPASELPNSISLTRYRAPQSCMFLLQIREKKRQEKISGILSNNSALGPAVHEGGIQWDTPCVRRPPLLDLGCSVRPAYMIRVHSPEAVTAGPWPRRILQGLVWHQFWPDELSEWLYPP